MNVKGNAYTVTNNTGQDSWRDGFSVHQVTTGWGVNNVFHLNQSIVNGPGYGYYIQTSGSGNVLGCDNTAVNAAKGVSNVACT
jgi:hypothetical protein